MTCSSPAASARIVLPVPAVPSSATTVTAGSQSRSRANCCSFERGRSPHASIGRTSGTSAWSRWRTSTDWLPARSTANWLVSRSAQASASKPATSSTATPPGVAKRRSIRSADTSRLTHPLGRRSSARPRRRWCSMASSPTCAALMRSAASFDTTTVGPCERWPRAAARMRLSALVGSSPLAATSSIIRPLVSMRSVPPPGSCTAWRMSPPLAMRSSSIVRITARAARPTSSMRVLCWSSSSTTTSGMTASAVGEREQRVRVRDEHRRVEHHPVDAPATAVSDAPAATAGVVGRDGGTSRSVTGLPQVRAPRRRHDQARGSLILDADTGAGMVTAAHESPCRRDRGGWSPDARPDGRPDARRGADRRLPEWRDDGRRGIRWARRSRGLPVLRDRGRPRPGPHRARRARRRGVPRHPPAVPGPHPGGAARPRRRAGRPPYRPAGSLLRRGAAAVIGAWRPCSARPARSSRSTTG